MIAGINQESPLFGVGFFGFGAGTKSKYGDSGFARMTRVKSRNDEGEKQVVSL